MIFAMHLMYVDLASQSAIMNYLWTGSRTTPRFPFGARTAISWTISLGWENKYAGPCFNQYIPAWLPTRRCKILLETVPRRQRRLTWWWHGPSGWESNCLTIWLTAISRVSWSEIEISIIFPCTLSTGKTIQVISFLSAIMCKRGVIIDRNRRRKHVSRLQDLTAWKERRELPPANSQWPTCLIIAPSTVVSNWEREFITVRSDYGPFRSCPNPIKPSGGISKLVCMLVVAKNGSQ